MATDTFSHAQLAERFQQLDAFLLNHQALWRPRPFTHRRLPWETAHPELARWLRSRSLAEAEASHNHPADLTAPAPFPQLAAQAKSLSVMDLLPGSTNPCTDVRQLVDVPGRKWLQIQAFGSALAFSEHPAHWLDWCAGKGHLGRLLAARGGALTCLEWDSTLVTAGSRLSERLGIPATHRQQDVMDEGATALLDPMVTPVALHACGDLHVRLIDLSIAQRCRQLAIAPCCYNRIQTTHYQPMSKLVARSDLQLSRDDLGLPLNETVTAGARERRQRDQSMAWRLGFDLLQREFRGEDAYLPTPSLPATWLKKSFERYCRDLAALKELPEPPAPDWTALERCGWQRLAEVRNLELLRGLFRRPLELWLLLDRALLLAENGYAVRLGTFCPAELTPRNLMLIAELDAHRANT
ncbi:SAM-dependent methyltransferase [Stutzerimonas stutzeri]|uniref:SAM-dependent methyltransferase n=1 Tax=Stutzerimonas stutzeri TaxID=316 RepID=W8R3A7_STUST|nr:methyltransferase [Stutzerimonas stutzeri]AHL77410.1 SAM-dependent methyltransferase [Stutzerimonas stutzeri]MCQ4330308.1 SAM-dependent methyltransferase [Stutzerimonas stutzeri]